ncbi:MAG: TIGR04086 family membrane protein [Niameybacter sp.]|uniref:TIGR04086 family membrane protein n=1 Tax=Niameybacter sp. TaxID=2033640 RepID=UPI002FCBCD43
MSKHKSKKKLNINVGDLGMTLFKSNLVAYALTGIFIIFATLLITYTNLGPNFEKWIIIIGTIASAALVGYDTAKQQGKQGYKWGLIGGLSYLIIFMLIGVATGGAKGLGISYVVMMMVLVLISSALAGMFSVVNQK